MKPRELLIRPARREDANALAKLINIAGEGIPLWRWQHSCGPDDDPFSFGAQRAAGDSGGFSYTNAYVAEYDSNVAAMLPGYRLPDPYETGDLDELPDIVRPLIELESLAPGSWYINAIATFDSARGRELGTRLLALARSLARESAATALSLIVARENKRAYGLYEREGYGPVARQTVIPYTGCSFTGDWVLMRCPTGTWASDTRKRFPVVRCFHGPCRYCHFAHLLPQYSSSARCALHVIEAAFLVQLSAWVRVPPSSCKLCLLTPCQLD